MHVVYVALLRLGGLGDIRTAVRLIAAQLPVNRRS